MRTHPYLDGVMGGTPAPESFHCSKCQSRGEFNMQHVAAISG
jgi:hypothetical protein